MCSPCINYTIKFSKEIKEELQILQQYQKNKDDKRFLDNISLGPEGPLLLENMGADREQKTD